MADALRHPGALLGVARFFHDPRASMRGLLDSRPGEGRLFAYAMAAAAIWIVGRIAVLLGGMRGGDADHSGLVVANAFSIGFVALLFYALAALGTGLARAFGGAGGWRDGRAAFFWAALVSAPVMMLTGLAPLAMPGAPGAVLALVAQAGPVFFAWALAECYAEAFGFRRAWAVFAVIAGVVLAVFGLAWAVRI